VAITRAENRLMWVVRNRLGRPQTALTVADLKLAPAPLTLQVETDEALQG
jgi:exodeoxyribonuclease-5